MQIKDRWIKKVICEGNASVKELAEKNKANLSEANLYGADLSGANLSGANLYRADLYGADLSGADLSGADLSGANLSGVNLYGAHFSGVNIEFVQFPSIRFMSSILLAGLSDDLQTELMRRDALAHPHPEKFDVWKQNGGPCPYDNVERFWLFEPKRELWSPGPPQMADRDLIIELCRSQGWRIRGYLDFPLCPRQRAETEV